MSKWLAVGVMVCSLVLGSASVARAQAGGWVSLNAAFIRPPQTTITQTSSFRCCSPSFFGNFESTVTAETPNKVSFDLGAGVRFSQFGVGVAVSRYVAEEPGNISFSVPHPLFVGRPATAQGTTDDPLKQEETAVHIEARYVGNLPHASISVFAGPTYFRAKRQLVEDFTYLETLGSQTLNYTVSLVSNTTETHEFNKWGFNVGADIGYYFGDNVGVGVLVRYSKASVDLPISISSTGATESHDLGGTTVGGGVRFRF
jgi:hypothetical protein